MGLLATVTGCGTAKKAVATSSSTQATTKATAHLAAVPAYANPSMVQVYTIQGKPVYLNASVTPLLFFARSFTQDQKDIAALQKEIKKLKRQVKPIILVSTFFHSANLKADIAATQAFVKKYHITLPVVIQAGPATEYVKSVPTLWYFSHKKLVMHTGTVPLSLIQPLVG